MKVILTSLLFLISSSIFAHKFYVSIADLAYNDTKQRIEGSLKLTAHDFEEVLKAKFNRSFLMEEVKDSSAEGRYVQLYLMQNFKVFSGGKELVPNYLGKEVSLTQDLYFYFTFSAVPNPQRIKVYNTLLFDLFPKQQNIVHYTYNHQTKSVTLVPTKNNDSIVFE